MLRINITRITHKPVAQLQAVGDLNEIHTQHLVAGTINVMSFGQNVAVILQYVVAFSPQYTLVYTDTAFSVLSTLFSKF